jgi:TRAP-type C4-dicarboxylate transport system permease small subunit
MFRNVLSKFFDRLITSLHAIGTGLVFALMALIVTDVLGRAFFNHPVTGAPELVKVTMVTLLFLGLAKTWQQGRHIRATLLTSRCGPRLSLFFDMFAHLCSLFVFILLAYSSWNLMLEAWRTSEYEGAGALRVPTYPLRTLITVSSILCALQLGLDCFKIARRWKDGPWR